MKFAVIIFIAAVSSAMAGTPMPRPTSLPNVVLECFRSYATRMHFPESPLNDGEFPIDGDNFDTPTPRYRLQVVNGDTLKIIESPTIAAIRRETVVMVSQMMRDFTNRHSIVGWQENDKSGGLTLYTLNFDDLIFSTTEVTSAKAYAAFAGVSTTVMKCRKVSKPT